MSSSSTPFCTAQVPCFVLVPIHFVLELQSSPAFPIPIVYATWQP